jgi:hypothetical protein
MHVLVGIWIWYIKGKKVPIHNLFVNGSLLFFLTALTAKSFVEFYKSTSTVDHPHISLFVIIGLIIILLPTTALYGAIVNAIAGGSQHDIPPEAITRYSFILSVLAIIYSFTNYILVLNFGQGGKP